MKKIAIIFCFLFGSASVFAQHYNAVNTGSQVKFNIKNFGLNVAGSFSGVEGKIIFDPANLSTSNFTVSVSAESVNTNNGSRDKHLKKEDYFDVAKYPKLTFASTKVNGNAGAYTIEGILTIKGISKKISFPFTATATSDGYHFGGKFILNRRDFNVGGSSWVLSDDLTVSLNISAIK